MCKAGAAVPDAGPDRGVEPPSAGRVWRPAHSHHPVRSPHLWFEPTRRQRPGHALATDHRREPGRNQDGLEIGGQALGVATGRLSAPWMVASATSVRSASTFRPCAVAALACTRLLWALRLAVRRTLRRGWPPTHCTKHGSPRYRQAAHEIVADCADMPSRSRPNTGSGRHWPSLVNPRAARPRQVSGGLPRETFPPNIAYAKW
jgi:hypothetical protein